MVTSSENLIQFLHKYLVLQVVHTALSELEQQEKLPRRLVAALQSMFTNAAGTRQGSQAI